MLTSSHRDLSRSHTNIRKSAFSFDLEINIKQEVHDGPESLT